MPTSDLVEEARRFWFGNAPGPMEVEGWRVRREDIERHGGPNPLLTDARSQRLEWLSRIRQRDLFEPHSSPQEEACRVLCGRQGDERWAHVHQNFDFALGCDAGLPAPKCLCLLPRGAGDELRGPYERFLAPRCDQWNLVLRRRLARACQTDLAARSDGVTWSAYDFLLTVNVPELRKFTRPDLPIILCAHDLWLDDAACQWVVDWLQPDVLLTPYPSPWRRYVRLSPRTRVVFSPFAPSMFFTRPNLDPARKRVDLLVVGKLNGARGDWIYGPRRELDAQIAPLAAQYRIEFSHEVGARRNLARGPAIEEGPRGTLRFLNQWSSYLGSARFVVFGRLADEIHAFVLGKYYEALGSGAIPILPEVPDLGLLGIEPFVHYIPLAAVEGNNDRLTDILDGYDQYRYIACNAVQWSATHVDRLLFDDFEALVRELTGRRYPRRIIG